MSKSSNISAFHKALFFALGLLVAVFVVSQEVIGYHCSKLSTQVEEQDQANDESSETEVAMLSCDVLLPGNSISLEPFTPIFIKEVVHEVNQPTPLPERVSFDNTPYFKILFRQVISPNAP